MIGRSDLFTLRLASAIVIGLGALFLVTFFLPLPSSLQGMAIMPVWLHSSVEIFSIIVSMMVFGVAWNAYSMERSGNVMVIACVLLAVGLFDLAHMLSYRGMPDFVTPAGVEKAINFWLAARFVFALGMFYIALAPSRPLSEYHHRYQLLAAILALIAAVYWLGLYQQQAWPRTFIEGQGLTAFKIVSEYTIAVILLVPSILLYRQARHIGAQQESDISSLFAAVAITILSELFFTRYSGPTDVYNLLGHLYKIVAYLFIYRAVFVNSVREPFQKLVQAQQQLGISRRMLRSILDGVPARIFWKDLSSHYLGGNRLFLRDAGLSDNGELIGKDDFDFFPKHAPGFQEVDRRVMATSKPELNFVERLQRADGEEIWLITSKVPLRGEDGRVIGVLGTYTDITEYRRAEEELKFKNTLLAIQQEVSMDGMLTVGAMGNVLSYNQRFIDLWRVPPEVLESGSDAPVLQFVLGWFDDPDQFLSRVRYLYEQKHETSFEEIALKDKRVFERFSAPIFGSDGEYYGRLWTFHDITARKQAEEEMRLAAKVFDGSGESIMITDAEANILSVNQAFTRLTGYTLEEVKGKNPRILSSGRHDAEFYRVMWETLGRDGLWQGEIWDKSKNGRIYPKWISISAIRDERGTVTHYMSVAADISERKESEKNIHMLAYYDALTGLPNRTLLRDRIEQSVAAAHRDQQKFALLFIDLDRFKYVNDSMGHAAGDKLLQGVAQRLQESMREGDTVSRIGGDEFVVLLRETEADGAARTASKLLGVLGNTYDIDGMKITAHASIGISIYPDNAEDAEALLKYADVAMYRAKEEGRNNFQFFAPEMNFRSNQLFSMEGDLRLALECHEFSLHYQPQLDLHDGRVCGAEALLRWNSPQKGFISPGVFIPVAEETGQILAIGEWVLHAVCAQLSAWRKQGMPVFPVAVNLSIRQLRQANLHLLIAAALEKSNLQPSDLELEITESIMMGDAQFVTTFWQQMQELGVQLSIDDFGTGYSSLSYLKKLPVDKLKIDQSFVRDIEVDENDDAIVRSIIGLGHQFKLKVIAEGVETREQLDFLLKNGCDEIQGYYYSRPLPAEEFVKFVNSHPKFSLS